MTRYANYGGNSSVVGYEIEPTRIIVWFRGGKAYSYSYASAGTNNVETMKRLALEGAGLCSFINRNVRYSYE